MIQTEIRAGIRRTVGRVAGLAPVAPALLLAGCAAYGGPHHGGQAGGVPPGHMPPPGECRIWYPERPPGQQPPPGPCPTLMRQVPPGAWLVRG